MPREPVLRNTCCCPWTSLLQCVFHPTDHVQQEIHPTDNPPQSALKIGAGKTRHRVGLRWGLLRSSTRQNLRVLVMQSSAPAPGAQSPWDSVMGAIEDSISQCTFLQMTYTAENPHADGSVSTGARPRFRPPRRRDPTTRLPHPRQQDVGKIDVLSSSNGPFHSRAAAKMSPHIRIGPEPVPTVHAPSPPAAGSHCPARTFSSPLQNRIFN
jgi:hypothetical protein